MVSVCQLWFDVEERYKTIQEDFELEAKELWFDVEERYKTILTIFELNPDSCGLM